METRAGVCIIKNDKLLILQQNDSEAKWGPPGGHGEQNETLIETAIRECKEEADLDVKITSLIQAAILERGTEKILIAIYMASIIGSDEVTIQEEEVSQYAWASQTDIESDVYPLRNSMLKPIFLKAFAGKLAPLDTLVQISHL